MNQNNNKNNSNKPKKPIIYYYAVVMLVLAMLNLVMVPFMKTAQIEDANYSTFVKETNKVERSLEDTKKHIEKYIDENKVN